MVHGLPHATARTGREVKQPNRALQKRPRRYEHDTVASPDKPTQNQSPRERSTAPLSLHPSLSSLLVSRARDDNEKPRRGRGTPRFRSPEMEASGSWDAIDWNQIEDPRSRRSSQGMEEFLLEDEEVYAQGHGVVLLNTDEAGIVSVTNFRLLFVSQATKSIIELGTIPLTTIEKLNDDVKLQSMPRQYDKKQPRELLQVIGKDMRVIVFAFRPRTKQKNEVFDALRRYTKPANLWDLYAFSCDPSTVDKKSDPKSRLLEEYRRLFTKWFPHSSDSGFEVEKESLRKNLWRLTTVNSSYSLCSTYPSQLIVPRSISDEDLWQASTFRAGRRLPIISWCDPESGAVLARSSQPLVGLMMNFRNNADEKLVSALCPPTFDPKGTPRKLYIVDARPRANALANGAKGGGSEHAQTYCFVTESSVYHCQISQRWTNFTTNVVYQTHDSRTSHGVGG
uniref:Uncharacterized protein n=1 Tax=Avena sativa TaxID=4498 RepID=A0ACD6ACV0_AVESA